MENTNRKFKIRITDNTGDTELEQLLDQAITTVLDRHNKNGQWAYVGSRAFAFTAKSANDTAGLLADATALREMLLASDENIVVTLTGDLVGGCYTVEDDDKYKESLDDDEAEDTDDLDDDDEDEDEDDDCCGCSYCNDKGEDVFNDRDEDDAAAVTSEIADYKFNNTTLDQRLIEAITDVLSDYIARKKFQADEEAMEEFSFDTTLVNRPIAFLQEVQRLYSTTQENKKVLLVPKA